MKALKNIFSGVGSMLLGAVMMLSMIALSYFVIIKAFNITGWSLLFLSPAVIIGAILFGIIINAAIYVIIDDVIKHKARKLKKAEQANK